MSIHAGLDTRRVSTAIRIAVLATMIGGASLGYGLDKEAERLEAATTVIREILDMPDGIPQELLDKAECVVVMPSVKKFAIGIGGSYGRGAMVCRSGHDFDGPWGAPSMYRLEGGNIGFQLGGEETDFVFLVMNSKGVRSLLESKVKLGVDASAAAGPKGRTTGASTDVRMTAEILTYSRARGLFAGVAVEGSTLRPDDGANEKIYGRKLTASAIVLKEKVVPVEAQELVELLQRATPENLSE